jgi:hypothetical protein
MKNRKQQMIQSATELLELAYDMGYRLHGQPREVIDARATEVLAAIVEDMHPSMAGEIKTAFMLSAVTYALGVGMTDASEEVKP